MAEKRADTIAKEMFFVGLFGLPWLWVVNIMYFWDTVYGRLPCFGDGPAETGGEEATGILGVMEGNSEEEKADDDADGDSSNVPTQGEIQYEVCKWVKRSSIGSVIVFVLFLSWIITFQLNQDNFGPKWFVMSQEEAERTGW